MSEWHYIINGEQQGPVEKSDLINLIEKGTIPSDTMVWKKGFEDWTSANQVDDLVTKITADELLTVNSEASPDGGGNEPEKPKSKTLGTVVTILGIAAGTIIAKLLPPGVIFQLFVGTLAGYLVGLIPYKIGKKRGELILAKRALITCSVCGFVLGLLLALPVCIIFVIIILTRKRKGTPILEI